MEIQRIEMNTKQLFNDMCNADIFAEQCWEKTGLNWWVFQSYCYEILQALPEEEQKIILKNLTKNILTERLAQIREKQIKEVK